MTADLDRATPPAAASGDLAALVEQASHRVRSRLRSAVFIAENALVLALLAWWLAVGRDGHVNGLLVLFLYCFPSEFLIAPVPHEPVLVYFGKIYAPWLVALVSLVGTLVVETLNYHAFGFVADSRPLRRVVRSGIIKRVVALFGRLPFAALVIGGLAPIPYYPLRFVVVLARYPLHRYLAALALSRLPRFYLLALLGSALRIPDGLLVAAFAPFVLIGVAPLVPWAKLRRQPAPVPVPSSETQPMQGMARPATEEPATLAALMKQAH
jgi:membrane protein YqaA with SNARE-associated domain